MLLFPITDTAVNEYAWGKTFTCPRDKVKIKTIDTKGLKLTVPSNYENSSSQAYWNFSMIYAPVELGSANDFYHFGNITRTLAINLYSDHTGNTVIHFNCMVTHMGIGTKRYFDVQVDDDNYTVAIYNMSSNIDSYFTDSYTRITAGPFTANYIPDANVQGEVFSWHGFGVSYFSSTPLYCKISGADPGKLVTIEDASGKVYTYAPTDTLGNASPRDIYVPEFLSTYETSDPIDIIQNMFDGLNNRISVQVGELSNIFVSR